MDNNGYVLAPLPIAPVNETDMVLLPKDLKALKKVAKKVGLDLRGAYLNLDGGFDSTHNRKRIFNAGMIPNIRRIFPPPLSRIPLEHAGIRLVSGLCCRHGQRHASLDAWG
jgi:hypothetical protein